MGTDYKPTIPEFWRARMGWNELPRDLQEQIDRFGAWAFGLGQHIASEIQEIKYEGRLVILLDGSRWEVDSRDALVADMWQYHSKVVVIDDEMFNIEDVKRVVVKKQA